MKRDWDIIRRILVQIETLPTEDSDIDSDQVTGCDAEKAAYHMRLLMEAGLIIGGCRNAVGGPPWCQANRLTWAGHEFLDTIRRDTVWSKVKTIARERGVDLSLDVITDTAKAVVKSLLE